MTAGHAQKESLPEKTREKSRAGKNRMPERIAAGKKRCRKKTLPEKMPEKMPEKIAAGKNRLQFIKTYASIIKLHAPVAQLDRASGYGPEGRGFESSSACQQETL